MHLYLKKNNTLGLKPINSVKETEFFSLQVQVYRVF